MERKDVWSAHPCTARRGVSTLPNAGYGLFADRDYARGEHVVYYTGLYGHMMSGDRVLQVDTRGVCIDGSDVECRDVHNRGDLCNHQPKGGGANCAFRLRRDHPAAMRIVDIVTTRAVAQGHEFYVDYGRHFFI
jgi:hypothetical protein